MPAFPSAGIIWRFLQVYTLKRKKQKSWYTQYKAQQSARYDIPREVNSRQRADHRNQKGN